MLYPLIVGNWKLNGSKHMINKTLTKLFHELNNAAINYCIAIAPPTIYLTLVRDYIGENKQIALSAQNVDIHLSGSYTGEISAEMLKDVGVKYVIIGHSERRIYHRETDILIAEKFAILKKVGLIPILCIGENRIEKEAGQTRTVCAHQIDTILNIVGIGAFENTIIAYEPVWAIGIDKSAEPSDVQMVHEFIRSYISKYDKIIAEQIIIQYGGSVNAINADKLFAQTDVDGALIGRAALQADSFAAIVKIAMKSKNRALDTSNIN